jgi:hypothetical protein
MVHIPVVFHPGGRTPGGNKEGYLALSGLEGILNKRNLVAFSLFHGKTCKTFINLLDTGPVTQGKITTVQMGPGKGIAQAFIGIII